MARALVRANGLSDRVEILAGELDAIAPREVDVAFGELLNADPFAEGIVATYATARGWLAPGGVLLPSRLRVSVALVEDTAPVEVRRAGGQVRALAQRFALDASPLEELLVPSEPYRYLAPAVRPLGQAELCTVELARARQDALPTQWELSVQVLERAHVGGAAVLFEAELGSSVLRSGGHFGVLVQGFADSYDLAPGGRLRLRVVRDEEDRLVVTPLL